MSKPAAEEQADELAVVLSRRKDEASEAGMSLVEARLFAESEIDIGELRRLVRLNWPSDQIARVLL